MGPSLVIVLIACSSETCGAAPLGSALQQAAHRVLGADADIRLEHVNEDPPDEQSAARAAGLAGVVEVSFASDSNRARLHYFVSREQRWLDREIDFGERRSSALRESIERGRLLGFAAATMFDAQAELGLEPSTAAPPELLPPRARAQVSSPAEQPPQGTGLPATARARRSMEFAAILSSGVRGTAAGLGASAGLRLAWTGPVWLRVFMAGRSGNIPEAQASTRTALLGSGLALALLPEHRRFELGVRLDAFACYFDASHLSEDDVVPDKQSRWLGGGDVLAEASLRIAGDAGLLLGVGLEAVLGKTEIFTHHDLVAVVPPLRVVAELGFRTQF